MADLEARAAAAFPDLTHFLRTTLWPETDGYNLLELSHRVMRHWKPTFVQGFVRDLEALSADTSFSDADLVELFSRDVPARWIVLDEHTARAVVRALAGYVRYLYDVEQVRGA